MLPSQFVALSEREKILVMEMINEKQKNDKKEADRMKSKRGRR